MHINRKLSKAFFSINH